MNNENKIIQQLDILSHEHKIAFIASCCERIISIYEAFTLVETVGDYDLFRDTLDKIWGHLKGKILSNIETQRLAEMCETVIPQSDNFRSIFTLGAINTGIAIIYSLQYCNDRNSDHVRSVRRLINETVEDYVFVVNFPYTYPVMDTKEIDDWIKTSPLVLAEFNKQQQDLSLLEIHPALNEQILDELRYSASQIGIHPFKRGLVVKS